MSESIAPTVAAGPSFSRETLVKGRPARLDCHSVAGQTFVLEGGPLLRVARLEEEWFEDLRDPAAAIEAWRHAPGPRPDILTFWQRMPDTEVRHAHPLEWEEIAVLPITTHDQWWKHQIKARVRTQIRKAEKEGLVVKEVAYDDHFVRGMTAIFNESPVRQGRPFWHYGKSFETVKAQFSRYLYRERMIGAYFDDELIGFIMLGDAGRFGLIGQVISSLAHRDKSPNNALIAKAVEMCAELELPYLIYLFWGDDSLAEFKRRCGFEPVRVPRYCVPLTWKGRVALQLGLHKGWKAWVPGALKARLKRVRTWWYGRRSA